MNDKAFEAWVQAALSIAETIIGCAHLSRDSCFDIRMTAKLATKKPHDQFVSGISEAIIRNCGKARTEAWLQALCLQQQVGDGWFVKGAADAFDVLQTLLVSVQNQIAAAPPIPVSPQGTPSSGDDKNY